MRSSAFVASSLGTFSLCVLACGPSHQHFIRRVEELSGTQSVDCGFVPVGTDLAPSLTCLETQLSGSRPFRVAVETYGLESVLVLAVVRSTSGQLKYVSYDPDGCNHSCWFKRPRMSEGDCPRPQVVKEPDGSFARDPIECIGADR